MNKPFLEALQRAQTVNLCLEYPIDSSYSRLINNSNLRLHYSISSLILLKHIRKSITKLVCLPIFSIRYQSIEKCHRVENDKFDQVFNFGWILASLPVHHTNKFLFTIYNFCLQMMGLYSCFCCPCSGTTPYICLLMYFQVFQLAVISHVFGLIMF